MKGIVVFYLVLISLVAQAQTPSGEAALPKSQASKLSAQALIAGQADVFSHNMQYGKVPDSFGEYQHFIPMHWCCYEVDLRRELRKAGERHATAVHINIEPSMIARNSRDAKYNLSSLWWKKNTGSYPPKWHLMNPLQQRLKFLYDLDWMSKTVYDIRHRFQQESNLRNDVEIGVFLGNYFIPVGCEAYFSMRNPGVSAPASGIAKGQYPPLLSMIDCVSIDYYKPPDVSVEGWLGPWSQRLLGRFMALPIRKYAWIRVETDNSDRHLPCRYLPSDKLREAFEVSNRMGVDGITLVEFAGATWQPTDMDRQWGDSSTPYPNCKQVEDAVEQFQLSGH